VSTPRTLPVWLCAGLLCAAAVVGAGEPAGGAPDFEALRGQLEERLREVDAVRATRDELREAVRRSPELTRLREALDEAEAAYQEKKNTDEAYLAACEAEAAARGALEELVLAKLAANAEARRLRETPPESDEAQKEASRRLDAIRRIIERDDPDVQVARAKLQTAATARRQAYEAEAFSALRSTRDKAREAHDRKLKELEEANTKLVAALKRREELRVAVRALEQKIGGPIVPRQKAVAGPRPCAVGPYLTHLGPDRVTISWETEDATTGRVEYRVRPGQNESLDSATASRLHRVTLRGLPPATECHYRVHVGAEATPWGCFTTAPAGPAPFHFAVYGDSRSNPRYHAGIAQGILAHQPAFVVHTGDFVSDGLDPGQWGPQFFWPAAELLRGCPILPAMGTHDRNSILFHRYFGLVREPLVPDGQPGLALPERPAPAWFAWTYGDVDLFVINSYAPYAPGGPQFRWLDAALASSRARWRVAVSHKTFFSSGRHGGSDSLRRDILPLLLKHGVDVVFVGHEHIYERTCAIGSGPQPSEKALVEVVTGGGGASLHKVKPGPWTECASGQRNYCIVAVDGDVLSITAFDEAGAPFDCVVLRKRDGRREFGETVPAAALEFLEAIRRFEAFSFPHPASGVRKRELSFTVRNPYPDAVRAELSWEIANKAWSIDPPRQSLHVAAGGSQKVAFTVELDPLVDDSDVTPLPRAVLTAGGRTVAAPAFALDRRPRPRVPVLPDP